MDIHLKFINLSNASQHPAVVLFQDQVVPELDGFVMAWKVIRNCGYENYHPFVFPQTGKVASEDSYGNYTPTMEALPGSAFRVYQSTSGHALAQAGKSSSVREIEVRNELSRGAVNAKYLKDDRPVATKTAIAPGQKALFLAKPALFIGVASGVEEGTLINTGVFTGGVTKMTLIGICSAEIVMTGGGPGPDAQPFTFTLENVSMA